MTVGLEDWLAIELLAALPVTDAIAGAAAAALVPLGAGTWYARRRWLR